MHIAIPSSVVRAALVSVVALVILAVVSVGMAVAGPDRGRAATLSAPVIHESFTPLPCSGSPRHRSTLQLEGCAEQQILRTDKTIDRLNRTLFTILSDNAARRRFVAGHDAWLSYRHAFCLSRSDVFEGGTEAAVLDAVCVAGVNEQHITDLKMFVGDLTSE
jgi:uncharacterized protein YecT (DUF1311 family)